jgi:CyaY protein
MYSAPVWPHADKAATAHTKEATPPPRLAPLTKIFCSIPMAQIVMTDIEFLDRAELLLKAVELACDRINDDGEADIDNQRVGGMITLTFENKSQIIINLQKPLHEVWLAARSGGYHFKFEGQQWADTKGQGEFFERLSKDASTQTGLALAFHA